MEGPDIMSVSVFLSIRRIRKALVTPNIFAQEWLVARVNARVYAHILNSSKSFSTVANLTSEGSLAGVCSVVID